MCDNVTTFTPHSITEGYSDVRIIGISNTDRDGTATKKDAKGDGKYSVVPYGGSKPAYPNVRVARGDDVNIDVYAAHRTAVCRGTSAI